MATDKQVRNLATVMAACYWRGRIEQANVARHENEIKAMVEAAAEETAVLYDNAARQAIETFKL